MSSWRNTPLWFFETCCIILKQCVVGGDCIKLQKKMRYSPLECRVLLRLGPLCTATLQWSNWIEWGKTWFVLQQCHRLILRETGIRKRLPLPAEPKSLRGFSRMWKLINQPVGHFIIPSRSVTFWLWPTDETYCLVDRQIDVFFIHPQGHLCVAAGKVT